MLAEYWSACAHRGFHPKDESHIPPDEIIDWTPRQARTKIGLLKTDKSLQRKVHRSLFALPYLGNLESAKVFILFGNPSLGTHSYADEHSNKNLVNLCIRNLKGECKSFIYLDPKLSGTGGGKYWRRAFKHLAKDIARETRIAEEESYAFIAERVAVLEACAYRSYRSPSRWAEELPSSKMIREYVHHILLPRAKSGEILLFVWRSAAFWKVQAIADHIILREPKTAQLEYLLERERKAIRQILLN